MNSITDPRRFIEQDKKIIISTVQKIPFILVEIATEGGQDFRHRDRRGAAARRRGLGHAPAQ
jgi:hypothetical protein